MEDGRGDASFGCVPFCFGGEFGREPLPAARAREEKGPEQEKCDERDAGGEDGADGDASMWAAVSGEAGDVSAEDVGVAGERVVGLVDGVAADDGGSAGDARLGIDDGVSAEDGGVAVDVTGDGEIAEENEDVSGEVSLDLDRAEEAAGVADLLPGSDKDVLAEVHAAGAMGACRREAGRLTRDGLRLEGGCGQKQGRGGGESVSGQRLAPFWTRKGESGGRNFDGKGALRCLRR